VRLLTLAGPGGVGKTRLALALMERVAEQFADGARFVDLSALREADLVVPAIMGTLGIHDTGRQPVLRLLLQALRTRQTLLVLDNFERLLDATAGLAELLSACPAVKVLVTSREPSGSRWEHLHMVPSLAVPDARDLACLDAVRAAPAVSLFVERARAADDTFALTEANAPTIATLCTRLDGLPLAIELAAARVRTLSPRLLLGHLDRQLDLLRGARDAPARQQSLRATLTWSYELLSDVEQQLVRRLGIFAGGCTLDAVEAVCPDVPGQVLSGLLALVDKNLVIQDEAAEPVPRYRLLETVRAYALEQLRASGELDSMRRRHAGYFCSLAEQLASHVQQPLVLDSLRREHDNLRTALRGVIDHGEVDVALRLGAALCDYWCRHGFLYSEGRRWLEEILALPPRVPNSRARAVMLVSAGIWAGAQGDRGNGRTLLEDGLALAREIEDRPLVARALNSLGSLAEEAGDLARARALLSEALATSREAGEPQVQVYPLLNLGRLAHGQGDDAAAGQAYEAARAIASALGDAWLLTAACQGLGDVARAQGQLARAQALYEAGLAAGHTAGDRLHGIPGVAGLGHTAAARGDYVAARRLFGESLALEQELGSPLGVLQNLEAFAALATAERRTEVAVRLAGAAAAWRREAGLPPSLTEEREQERWLAAARRTLGEAGYATEWSVGQTMAPDDAIALATHGPDTHAHPGKPSVNGQARRPSVGHRLSAREQEVAALVARGLSNREIAARLVITERTAGAHVEHILDKLGVASRTQIGVWAVEHGLIVPGPS
jgi:non-specific serine/threonine protein kinase